MAEGGSGIRFGRRCEMLEDSLRTKPLSDIPSLRKGHPEDKDELEGVVEREPVNGIDGRLNDRQEGVDDPVLSNIC